MEILLFPAVGIPPAVFFFFLFLDVYDSYPARRQWLAAAVLAVPVDIFFGSLLALAIALGLGGGSAPWDNAVVIGSLLLINIVVGIGCWKLSRKVLGSKRNVADSPSN